MFVCHGNICRSPMAEFIFKDMLKKQGRSGDFTVSSSATSTEEIIRGIGNPVYPPAKAELAKHGISAEGKRAVQLKKSDYEAYDFIIGMDSYNIRNILRITGSDPENKISLLLDFWDSSDRKDIADPWYTGDFETTYRDVLRGCEALLDKISSQG